MELDEAARLRALFRISVDTNLEFVKERTEAGPLFVVMTYARQDAMQALSALVHVDPSKVEDVRKLQNEVQRFIDLLDYVRKILQDGDEAAERLNTEDQEELRELIEGDVNVH